MTVSRPIPIVLLPGMDGTGELLDGLANRLAPSRPVHVVSYPLSEPLDYGALTAFAAARAPAGRFAVLGESFSGPVAIELAASEPRVAGLILASSFARHPLPSLFAPAARFMGFAPIPSSIVEAALLGAGRAPALKARLRELRTRLPPAIMGGRMAEALRVDKRRRLCEVACPVMCLHGRFDRVTAKRCLKQILTAQPQCQLRRFDAAHMLLETHAEEAAVAIDEFCDGLQ